MAPRRRLHRGGVLLVRPDLSLAIKSPSVHTASDSLLRDVEGYVPDSRDDEDIVD